MLQKIKTPITLQRDAEVVDEAPSFMQSGGNYMFYDRRTTSRKPNAYEKLIASANHSIWVWDPYLDSDSFPRLFAKVEAKTIRIEILTTLAACLIAIRKNYNHDLMRGGKLKLASFRGKTQGCTTI